MEERDELKRPVTTAEYPRANERSSAHCLTGADCGGDAGGELKLAVNLRSAQGISQPKLSVNGSGAAVVSHVKQILAQPR